ncbi:MAG: hypothetical protein J6K25_12325 [Thermoguttaceae bacterium]|nr:hypothetical protein [Thermoguttaceae bacterium]
MSSKRRPKTAKRPVAKTKKVATGRFDETKARRLKARAPRQETLDKKYDRDETPRQKPRFVPVV